MRIFPTRERRKREGKERGIEEWREGWRWANMQDKCQDREAPAP